MDDPGSDIFFAAIETTRMPMVLTDPTESDNPIVFANQAFIHMTGYSRAEIVGRNCRFLQGPETDQRALDEIRHAVRGRHEVATELLNYRKDGTSFWNALFISPVYDRSGALVYFFASQLDVSRRRDAEDALRRARRTAVVGQATGEIAHDLNNLLQVITGYMDGLKDHAARSGDPRLVRQVGAVAQAANRATSLNRRLLASSPRGRSGRLVSLNRLVDGMGGTIDRVLGKAVQLEVHLDGALWPARLDPSEAETALLDLVVNARDAMPAGGTVTIRTSNVEVASGDAPALRTLAPGRYAEVAIADTGVGVPEHALKRLTDPLAALDDEGGGAGLGLSTVHGFAQRSGGAVLIDSGVGRGTVVKLYVPAAWAGDEGAAQAGRPAAERGDGERILVVDDRPEVAELARTMLEEVGYTVEVAKDGKDALAKLDGHFDLLFSDLVMPGGIDGVSLAREARLRQPRLKVLLTTGYADPSVARGEAEFDTIAKPYRRNDLAEKVRLALDGPTETG